ncbi:MAG: helical backbone metal receptor [bacterium]
MALACFITFLTPLVRVASCDDAPTTRIVSLVPSVTETLFAIGAGGMVAGVSDYCNHPEQAALKPRVGALLNFDIEKIVSLRPTAVVILNSQADLGGKLEGIGIRAVTVRSDSLGDVFDLIATAGEMTGRRREAAELSGSIRASLARLREAATTAPRARALIIVGRQPASLQNIYAAGPATYLGEIIDAAGGRNMAPAGGISYPPLSKEQIAAMDPEVIIDLSPGEAGRNTRVAEAHTAAWKQLPQISAVRSGRIFCLADTHLTVPGPAIPETAQKIADLLGRR